jgi:uncharacterized protein DUF5919
MSIAKALGKPEHELWPTLEAAPRATAAANGLADINAVLSSSSDPDLPDWRDWADNATERVDLLDLTLASTITDSEDVSQLAAAAARGCTVRALVSHPESAYLAITERELGLNTSLAARAAMTAELNNTMRLLTRAAPEVQIRLFVGARSYSITRVDDHALVTLQIHGERSDKAPVLHLARRDAAGIFDRLTEHFDAVWKDAEPPAVGRS